MNILILSLYPLDSCFFMYVMKTSNKSFSTLKNCFSYSRSYSYIWNFRLSLSTVTEILLGFILDSNESRDQFEKLSDLVSVSCWLHKIMGHFSLVCFLKKFLWNYYLFHKYLLNSWVRPYELLSFFLKNLKNSEFMFVCLFVCSLKGM